MTLREQASFVTTQMLMLKVVQKLQELPLDAFLAHLDRKERDQWYPEIPGEHLGKITWTEPALVCEGARIARKLGFAVVAVAEDGAKTMRLYAVSREKI